MEPTNLILHFAGACTVVPGGMMGFAWCLTTDIGDRVGRDSGLVQGYENFQRTSNTAELVALGHGLRWLRGFCLFPVGSLTVVGSSYHAIQVAKRPDRSSIPHLAAIGRRCQALIAELRGMCDPVTLRCVPASENVESSELATCAIRPHPSRSGK